MDTLLFIHLLIYILFSVHAAVIAINEAIDHQDAAGTLDAMKNSNAHLVDINDKNAEEYQSSLFSAKETKSTLALAKVSKE